MGPAAAQASGYVQPDPRGDVFVAGETYPLPAPVPADTPVTSAFDIVEVGITDEDDVGLRIYVKVVDFKDAGDPLSTGTEYQGYQFHAKLEGTKTSYRMSWFPPLYGLTDTVPTGVAPVLGQFCVQQESDDGGPRGFGADCYQQSVEATVDWDSKILQVYVTKNALMGRDPIDSVPPPRNLPTALSRSMQLSDLFVEVQRNYPTPASDRAPDEGGYPSFVFSVDAANTKIRLKRDTGDILKIVEAGSDQPAATFGGFRAPEATARVSVTPGVTTLVPLRLENTNAAKRIVNLEAKAVREEDRSKVKLQILPSVQIPGSDSRIINLLVTAGSEMQHRDEAVVIVRGQSLGFVDEMAAARLTLVASMPPGPEHPTLHFHAYRPPTGDVAKDTLCEQVPSTCTGVEVWANTLPEDRKQNMDNGIALDNTFEGATAVVFSKTFEMDTPMASDLVMEAGKAVQTALAFKSDAEFPATVRVSVSTRNGNPVGEGSFSTSIKEGVVPVTFLPPVDALRVQYQEQKLLIKVRVEVDLTSGTGAPSLVPTFKFIPKDSSITFPFIVDPQAVFNNLLTGSSLLTLTHRTLAEVFVNPGRTKMLNATVTNEGSEAGEAHLTVSVSDPRWKVRFLPGDHYHLESGGSAKFSVSALAPDGAAEASQVQILISASFDPKSGAIASQLRFIVTITSGVDIPDEADWFHLDEESGGKVVGNVKKKNTPGFEALFLLAAVGLAMLAAARRRR